MGNIYKKNSFSQTMKSIFVNFQNIKVLFYTYFELENKSVVARKEITATFWIIWQSSTKPSALT